MHNQKYIQLNNGDKTEKWEMDKPLWHLENAIQGKYIFSTPHLKQCISFMPPKLHPFYKVKVIDARYSNLNRLSSNPTKSVLDLAYNLLLRFTKAIVQKYENVRWVNKIRSLLRLHYHNLICQTLPPTTLATLAVGQSPSHGDEPMSNIISNTSQPSTITYANSLNS